MGSFSNYAENKILDHSVGKASWTMPTAYIALSTADPTEDGSGLAEPSGGAYARKSTAAGDWNSAASGAISNANALAFAQATADWGVITHFALMDASSGGNMIAHGALDESRDVKNGDTFQFAAGDIDISQD